MGRIKIQLLGFAMLTILFITLSIAYPFITARPLLFLFIYGLAQFFFNFGPNATTVSNRIVFSSLYSFYFSSSFQEKFFLHVGVRQLMVFVRQAVN
jgi:hypothetical protein